MPGMFETYGRSGGTERKPSTLAKLDRIRKTFRHEEADRVPITDFFWGQFRDRWRTELGLPADADPYYHYDLDLITTVPNMDPTSGRSRRSARTTRRSWSRPASRPRSASGSICRCQSR